MFDDVAHQYDQDFTHTQIGKAQRRLVLNYLKTLLPQRPIKILELNCGTGEDAIWFAQQGHQVIATDASETMIEVAEKKLKSENLSHQVRFAVLNILDISIWDNNEKFDLIFSNFGGLNCLCSENLRSLAAILQTKLTSNGRFIAVVMGRWCLIESGYFLTKFKFNEMFRRNGTQPLRVKVGPSEVLTWYYHPGEFQSLFAEQFHKVYQMPVGSLIPPSFLEPFFQNRAEVLKRLAKAEDMLIKIPLFAYISDHFLMDFQKRNS